MNVDRPVKAYELIYTDKTMDGPTEHGAWRCFAHNEEHALERFYEYDDEGFVVVDVRRRYDRDRRPQVLS